MQKHTPQPITAADGRGMQHATYIVQHATCIVQHATHIVQHAPCTMQRAPSYVPRKLNGFGLPDRPVRCLPRLHWTSSGYLLGSRMICVSGGKQRRQTRLACNAAAAQLTSRHLRTTCSAIGVNGVRISSSPIGRSIVTSWSARKLKLRKTEGTARARWPCHGPWPRSRSSDNQERRCDLLRLRRVLRGEV